MNNTKSIEKSIRNFQLVKEDISNKKRILI